MDKHGFFVTHLFVQGFGQGFVAGRIAVAGTVGGVGLGGAHRRQELEKKYGNLGDGAWKAQWLWGFRKKHCKAKREACGHGMIWHYCIAVIILTP